MLHKPLLLLLLSLCAALHASDLRLAAGESQRHCPTANLETYMNMWEGVNTTTDAPDGLLRAAQTCNGGMCINIQDPNAINGITYLQFGDILTYEITVINQNLTLVTAPTVSLTLDPNLTVTSFGAQSWVLVGANVWETTIQANNNTPIVLTVETKMDYHNTGNCLEGGTNTLSFINQVSVIYDYGAGNMSLSETVGLLSIPDSHHRLPANTLTSQMGANMTGGEYFVEGLLTVDNNFAIQASDLLFASGAEVRVASGNILNVDGSRFSVCGTVMWKGIALEDNATLLLKNTDIEDAYQGLDLEAGATAFLTDAYFYNNRTGIFAQRQWNMPYTSIFLAGNNVFEGGNGMAVAYLGQPKPNGGIPYAGIDLSAVDLSIQGPVNCLFTNLNIGIRAWGGTLDLREADFSYIGKDKTFAYNSPIPYEDEINGSAVACRSARLNFVGSGGFTSTTSPVDFEFCDTGIFAHTSVLDVTQTRMESMYFYGIRNSPFKYFPCTIRQNKILTHRIGVSLERCDLSPTDVSDNIISLTFWEPETYTPANAIQVFESMGIPDNVQIKSNGISLYRPGNGIFLSNCNSTLVDQNMVLIDQNILVPFPNGTNGIYVEGGENLNIRCNHVDNNSQTAWSNLQYTTALPPDEQHTGIKVNGSVNWCIRGNQSGHFQNAYCFQGVSNSPFTSQTPGATFVQGFTKNWLFGSYYGLLLEPNAIIGQQGVPVNGPLKPDNAWADPGATYFPSVLSTFGSGYGAYDASLNALSPFYVHDLVPMGAFDAIYPPYFSITNPFIWFTPSTTPLANVAVNACGVVPPPNFNNLTLGVSNWDSLVAVRDSLTESYTEETSWQARTELISRILGDSSMLMAAEIQAFYDQHRLASQGRVAALRQSLSKLAGTEEAYIGLLDANRNAAMHAWNELLTLDSLLHAGNPQADTLTLLGQRTTLLARMDSLSSAYQQADSLYQQTLIPSLLSLSAETQELDGDEVYVQNYRTVYLILLQILEDDADHLNMSQSEDLFTVASQCPLSGGKAVFLARSIWRSYMGHWDFDDKQNCSMEGIGYRYTQHSDAQQSSFLTIFPNPADNRLNIRMEEGFESDIQVELYDVAGRKVRNFTLPQGQKMHSWDIAQIPSGIYTYHIRGAEIPQTGKLHISH